MNMQLLFDSFGRLFGVYCLLCQPHEFCENLFTFFSNPVNGKIEDWLKAFVTSIIDEMKTLGHFNFANRKQ